MDTDLSKQKAEKCILILSSGSLPSAASRVSASSVVDLVLLIVAKLLRCIGSDLASGVGLTSMKDSRRVSFVHPSVLVVFKRNISDENGTKKC